MLSDSDEDLYSNIIGRHQATEARRQAARAASLNSLQSQAREQVNALSAQAATERALNNLTGLADAYRASGMSGATGDAYFAETPFDDGGTVPSRSWVDGNGVVQVRPLFAGAGSLANDAQISESPGLLSRLGSISSAYANGRVGFGDAVSMANGQIRGIGNVARDSVTGLVNGAIDGVAFAASLAGPTPGDPLNLPRFGYTGRTGSLGPDIAMVAPMALGVRGVRNAVSTSPMVTTEGTAFGITNKQLGTARERSVAIELQQQYPGASVQAERILRTGDGLRAIDPLTGTARRIDHVVIQNGIVIDSVETTSLTANKAAQIAKENRIRQLGGTFVRDLETGQIVDLSNIQTRIVRKK